MGFNFQVYGESVDGKRKRKSRKTIIKFSFIGEIKS
jgi:hypothetical protein